MLLALFFSCGKGDVHSDLFDFDLDNGISIESTNTFLQLPKAYVDTAYQWDTVHLNLNDGSAGDSLVTECGSWSYEVNPTTTVEIWFMTESLEDGIYDFSHEAITNDFHIIVRRDLLFGPAFEFGNFVTENSMLSQNIVAQGFSNVSNTETIDVINASLQLVNYNTPSQVMRFVMELRSEDVVRGSYSGTFEPFRRVEFDSDCD